MPPKVSVVVTCFNLGRYLDEAIRSVEAQTLRDFEILIVDDGSDDPETLAVLDRYRPPRASVLRTENRGLPAARNHGVRHAGGELLCCLDADDRLHPTWLEKAVAELDRDPGLTFVSHWLRTFGDEVWEWTPTRCDFPALLDVNTVNGAALVRRSVWETVGGQDESLRHGCEDWDFWITLVERGFRGTILQEILFDYRRRGDSMSRAFDAATHRALYAQLVARHPASFTAWLPQLWQRRQQDFARTHDEIERLEAEWRSWLAAKRSDRAAQSASLDRLVSDVFRVPEFDGLHAQLREAAEAEQALTRRLDQLDTTLAAARHEIADLRASWSWRLTRPLRRVVGRLRGESGPRS